jgi:hypothetical protein
MRRYLKTGFDLCPVLFTDDQWSNYGAGSIAVAGTACFGGSLNLSQAGMTVTSATMAVIRKGRRGPPHCNGSNCKPLDATIEGLITWDTLGGVPAYN